MMIGQSGGPSPAINASLAGAVQYAMASGQIGQVYGMLHGLEGLLQRQVVSLSDQIVTALDFELLVHTPAMALGSCRYRLPKDDKEIYAQVLQILQHYNIGYFFYCGGNDSMDTIANLSAYFRSQNADIKCIGIPKTVDNDLAVTDHTPGFGSAARFVAASFSEIMIDSMAYPAPSVTVVEVMGRNAGWLTASSVLARAHGYTGPHLIYLPEIPFDHTAYIEKVREKLKTERHVVVAVSEGIRSKETGRYVSEKDSGEVDMFGHASLGGVADVLKTLAKEQLGIKARSIEPSVLQRVGMHLASGTDLREAQEVGVTAVKTALLGQTDVMICIKRVSNHPYLVRYETTPLENVANHERKVPLSWISEDGTNVTEEMVDYLRPLFRGETHVNYEDGLPRFFRINQEKLV
ncbi:6-phosphofructokinase [Ruminococcaceae bacterium OttesenSCG-928-A16]|nr:6-phosphofructokinase [Ruminococcaceae bacterium OttesenSCG-928-A16]